MCVMRLSCWFPRVNEHHIFQKVGVSSEFLCAETLWVLCSVKGRIYKRKIYFNNELRYQILGKAFGRLIMVIVVPIGTNKIKVFSARPASEYKEIYDDKAK